MPKQQPKAPASAQQQPVAVEPEVIESAEAAPEVTPPVAPAAPAAKGPMIKGRVLRACVYGQCDDVVEIPVSRVEALAGVIDTNPAAVAYAESLRK